MMTSAEMNSYLLNGLVQASMLLGFALLFRRYARFILAFVLVGAAIPYIQFAYQGAAPSVWLVIELVGVLIYGTMAVTGVMRSPWWLVAGWGLHTVWDMALHYFGPGNAFAPVIYPVTCLSFDLLVAAVIALGIILGWPHFSKRGDATGAARALQLDA